jgi:threonine synthase
VAYHALEEFLSADVKGKGIIISTAHPVKFPEIVEAETNSTLTYPKAVEGLMQKPSFKMSMKASYPDLKEFLMQF